MNYRLLSSSSISGTNVVNAQGESLGEINDLMINTNDGSIAYAVLSFGGFLGLGDKYFAIPWEAFSIDREDENMVLNVSKEKLENTPGFNKDDWPTSANHDYLTKVYQHYNYRPFGERETTMV